jgi:DNA-binding Lrp family transcriptional regulator
MPTGTEYDELDRRIAVALQANGRAPWGLIAKVLDAPVRTVTRRGQGLLDDGSVRVSTYLDTTIIGHARPLVIQIGTALGRALDVAGALARRADASSVSVLESGSDVVCQLMPRTPEDSMRLVLEELPAIDGLESIRVGSVLKFYRSGYDWTVMPLEDDALRRLREGVVVGERPSTGPVTLSPEDEQLVAVLASDGRASAIEIAERLGVSPQTAKRRLDALFEQGVLHVRTEIAPSVHGLRVEALTWLQIRPDQMEAVGTALAQHPSVRFCASCTGSTQMLVDTLLADEQALYRFLTEDVAALGVDATRTTVVMRAVRRGPMLMDEVAQVADL